MTLTFDDHLEGARLLYRSSLQDGAAANESAARYRQERDEARADVAVLQDVGRQQQAEISELLAEVERLKTRIAEMETGEPAEPEPPAPPAEPTWPPLQVRTTANLNLRGVPSTTGNDPLVEMPRGTALAALYAAGADLSGVEGVYHDTRLVANPAAVLEFSAAEREARDLWLYVAHGERHGWCAAWYVEPVEEDGPVPHFDSPVGTDAERAGADVWPGEWVDVTGYAVRYLLNGTPQYHTGADLNLNSPRWNADAGANVHACADGTVTYARATGNSWGNLIVIRHGPRLYSRYGHLLSMGVKAGDRVKCGDVIGKIGGTGGHTEHLHFDISNTDILGTNPQHWPGASQGPVLAHYVDPREWIAAHRPPRAATPALSASKLGPHIDQVLDTHFETLVESKCRFAVVNLASPRGVQLVRHLLSNNPGMAIVTRHTAIEATDFYKPQQAARDWLARMQGSLGALADLDLSNVYFTGMNEQAATPDTAAFEAERMRLLEALGFKAGLFNFAVGNPDYPAWREPWMKAVIEQARAGGHALCLHEYVGKSLDDLRDGSTGHLFLRYRKMVQTVGPLKVAITECGTDHIAQVPGSGPWQAVMSGEDYLALLRGFDAEWRKDEYVLGGAVFLHGAQSVEQWRRYEIAPIAGAFYEHIRNTR